jgi:hypothetical protein
MAAKHELTNEEIVYVITHRTDKGAPDAAAAKFGVSRDRIRDVYKKYYGGTTLEDAKKGLKIPLPVLTNNQTPTSSITTRTGGNFVASVQTGTVEAVKKGGGGPIRKFMPEEINESVKHPTKKVMSADAEKVDTDIAEMNAGNNSTQLPDDIVKRLHKMAKTGDVDTPKLTTQFIEAKNEAIKYEDIEPKYINIKDDKKESYDVYTNVREEGVQEETSPQCDSIPINHKGRGSNTHISGTNCSTNSDNIIIDHRDVPTSIGQTGISHSSTPYSGSSGQIHGQKKSTTRARKTSIECTDQSASSPDITILSRTYTSPDITTLPRNDTSSNSTVLPRTESICSELSASDSDTHFDAGHKGKPTNISRNSSVHTIPRPDTKSIPTTTTTDCLSTRSSSTSAVNPIRAWSDSTSKEKHINPRGYIPTEYDTDWSESGENTQITECFDYNQGNGPPWYQCETDESIISGLSSNGADSPWLRYRTDDDRFRSDQIRRGCGSTGSTITSTTSPYSTSYTTRTGEIGTYEPSSPISSYNSERYQSTRGGKISPVIRSTYWPKRADIETSSRYIEQMVNDVSPKYSVQYDKSTSSRKIDESRSNGQGLEPCIRTNRAINTRGGKSTTKRGGNGLY